MCGNIQLSTRKEHWKMVCDIFMEIKSCGPSRRLKVALIPLSILRMLLDRDELGSQWRPIPLGLTTP